MRNRPIVMAGIIVGVTAIVIAVVVIWRSLGSGYWVPTPTSAFLIKLGSPLDTQSPTDLGQGAFTYTGAPAQPPRVFDIDGNANTEATVATLHGFGAHVICYVPVGLWTPTMYNANDPRWAPLKGQAFNGVDRWLDTNPSGPHYQTLIDLMTQQFENCQTKGFDAIQPDGIDEAEGYHVGFGGAPLTVAEVNHYLEQLAQIAHSIGLSIGQLNYLDQSATLAPYFDFAIVESCYSDHTCGMLDAYAAAHKAIFEIEYTADPATFCPTALAAGRVAGRYNPNLNGKLRIPCR